MSERSPYRWIEQSLQPEPTKFPFAATINGVPVTVWPTWVEYPPCDHPWQEEEAEGGWLEAYARDKT